MYKIHRWPVYYVYDVLEELALSAPAAGGRAARSCRAATADSRRAGARASAFGGWELRSNRGRALRATDLRAAPAKRGRSTSRRAENTESEFPTPDTIAVRESGGWTLRDLFTTLYCRRLGRSFA